METIDFKDIDFNTVPKHAAVLGWDVDNGYTVTIWLRPIDQKPNNRPLYMAVLPESLSYAIRGYLVNGINDVL